MPDADMDRAAEASTTRRSATPAAAWPAASSGGGRGAGTAARQLAERARAMKVGNGTDPASKWGL
jgi:hypothetical protein